VPESKTFAEKIQNQYNPEEIQRFDCKARFLGLFKRIFRRDIFALRDLRILSKLDDGQFGSLS